MSPFDRERIAATITEGGVLTSDFGLIHAAARSMLVAALSSRDNKTNSGPGARIAGEAIGASLYLPTMATDEFLSCLSRQALEKAAIDAKVQGAAKLLRLDALLERRPTELSGGQRQRVAIGRAIVREPTIFLFDEPLSNLDAKLRVQMRTEITALHERLETTMIYVTHDQVEAMTMADKIVVMRDGRLEQIGAPLDLYNTPANRFVAGFIGSPRMNFLRGTIATTDADGLCLLLDAAAGKPVGPFAVRPGDAAIGARITLGVRPEHVSIASGDDQGIGLPAVIEQIEQLGGASVLYCALASGEKFTAHIGGQVARRPNEHVRVGFRASDGHVFRAAGGEAALERMERSATGSAD